MSRVAWAVLAHPAARMVAAVCLAGMLAGCADSERLADPFSNPFYTSSATTDPMPTGTIPQARSAVVTSRPLPAPAPVAAYTAPSHQNPHAAWAHQNNQQFASTGTVGRERPHGNYAGWTAEGGMPVVVATGETAGIIAKRYSIPEEALIRTNGFYSAAQIRPGTRLVIPIYNAALAASSGATVGHRHSVASRPTTQDHHKQARAHEEKRRSVAKAASKAARKHREIARAEHEKRVESKKRDEAKRHERHEKEVAERKHETSEHKHIEHTAKAAQPAREKVAVAAPEKKAGVDKMETGTIEKASLKAEFPAKPVFRWPAHGRIIKTFKPGRNDGINIALPEGTAVHAAESGVVAYAGNQLKGYGNLILIRHPDGYVTAYANNGKIEVKRGEKVRRGQVIAKSGETGDVTTPQLHFELRKGAKPLDPTQYLGS